MSNNYSYRLMNDNGALNVPLNVIQAVDRRYVGMPATERVEETWLLLVDVADPDTPLEDWEDNEDEMAELELAMQAAAKADSEGEEGEMVWLEITRPDNSLRRLLIYGGEFEIVEIENTGVHDGTGLDVAWTMQRHPQTEAVPADYVTANFRHTTAIYTLSGTSATSLLTSARFVSRPQDEGVDVPNSEEYVLVPTVAPARVNRVTVSQVLTNSSRRAAISQGWMGFHHRQFSHASAAAAFADPAVVWSLDGIGLASVPYTSDLTQILNQSIDLQEHHRGRFQVFATVRVLANDDGRADLELAIDGVTTNTASYSFVGGTGNNVALVNLGEFDFNQKKFVNGSTTKLDVTVRGNFVVDGNPASTTTGVSLIGYLLLFPAKHYVQFSDAFISFDPLGDSLNIYSLPNDLIDAYADRAGNGLIDPFVDANVLINTDEAGFVLPSGISEFVFWAQSESDDGIPGISPEFPVTSGSQQIQHEVEIVVVPRFYTL